MTETESQHSAETAWRAEQGRTGVQTDWESNFMKAGSSYSMHFTILYLYTPKTRLPLHFFASVSMTKVIEEKFFHNFY